MARDIRTISIFCAKCRTLLYKYRKSGRGGLVKCRPDRIVEDRTAGDLKCPDCGQDFARLAMMGGGPAHKIIQGPTRTGSALTELERCLRWGSSWSGRRRHPRKTDACQVVPYRNLRCICGCMGKGARSASCRCIRERWPGCSPTSNSVQVHRLSLHPKI